MGYYTPTFISGFTDGVDIWNSSTILGQYRLLEEAIHFNQCVTVTSTSPVQEKSYFGSANYGGSAGLLLNGTIVFNYPVLNLSSGIYENKTETINATSLTNGILPLDNGYCSLAYLRAAPSGNMTYAGVISDMSSLSAGQFGVIKIASVTPKKLLIPFLWRGNIDTTDNQSTCNCDGTLSGDTLASIRGGATPVSRWGGLTSNHPESQVCAVTATQPTPVNCDLQCRPYGSNFQVTITPLDYYGYKAIQSIVTVVKGDHTAAHPIVITFTGTRGGTGHVLVTAYTF